MRTSIGFPEGYRSVGHGGNHVSWVPPPTSSQTAIGHRTIQRLTLYGWNTQVLQILYEERYVKLHPELYAILFDESEEGPLKFPKGCKNVVVIVKPVPGAPKLSDFWGEVVLVCCVYCHLKFYFFVIK